MKLSRVEEVLLALVVPATIRDEFAGDLIEEIAHHWHADGDQRAARRWVRGQIVASAPSMLRFRLQRGGRFARWRWGASALGLLLGVAQALDSGILGSTPLAMALTALAIGALALAGLLATSGTVIVATWTAAIALTAIARVLSPVSLPELTLACGPIGLIHLFTWRACERARAGSSSAPPTAS
jgi:hypothetical protein